MSSCVAGRATCAHVHYRRHVSSRACVVERRCAWVRARTYAAVRVQRRPHVYVWLLVRLFRTLPSRRTLAYLRVRAARCRTCIASRTDACVDRRACVRSRMFTYVNPSCALRSVSAHVRVQTLRSSPTLVNARASYAHAPLRIHTHFYAVVRLRTYTCRSIAGRGNEGRRKPSWARVFTITYWLRLRVYARRGRTRAAYAHFCQPRGCRLLARAGGAAVRLCAHVHARRFATIGAHGCQDTRTLLDHSGERKRVDAAGRADARRRSRSHAYICHPAAHTSAQ